MPGIGPDKHNSHMGHLFSSMGTIVSVLTSHVAMEKPALEKENRQLSLVMQQCIGM